MNGVSIVGGVVCMYGVKMVIGFTQKKRFSVCSSKRKHYIAEMELESVTQYVENGSASGISSIILTFIFSVHPPNFLA